MREAEPDHYKTDLEALRALQADASELERIEGLLGQFNIFEAIGFVHQETKHSHFLAFLLDPRQNHSLSDRFLKVFLHEAMKATDKGSLPLDLDGSGEAVLSKTKVHTEFSTDDGRIDILLLNHTRKWAVVIENKIGTGEHSDQLGRYYRFVEQKYREWQVRGIYLTPGGDTPSHEAYLSFDYGRVCGIIERLLDAHAPPLRPDGRMSLDHYKQMLERNVARDSGLARLCNRVYSKHHKALDLIYRHSSLDNEESQLASLCNQIYLKHQLSLELIWHRYFHQHHVRDLVLKLIGARPSLLHDHLGTLPPKEFIGFRLREYDTPALRVAKGWGGWKKTGYILRFTVANLPSSLELRLQIGPGDESVRQRLLEMATNNPNVFRRPAKTPKGREIEIFARPILFPDLYQDASPDVREQEILRHWNEFLDEDLPRIEAALRREAWIWEPDRRGDPT